MKRDPELCGSVFGRHLARIMHHALSFCTAMRGPRALDRSGLDRFDCDSLCNAFGLICRLGGVSGLAAPRLKDRMA
jgi:hypothetical protein